LLEGEDLEHRVRRHICHTHGNAGLSAAVETLCLDLAFDEIVAYEMSAANIEGTEARSGVLAFGPVDAAVLDGVRLAKEFDKDGDSVDDPCSAKAPLPLVKM
jgi:hypothetical protein